MGQIQYQRNRGGKAYLDASEDWCSRAKANRVLPRDHTGHNKYPLLTTQRRPYKWTSTDGKHKNRMIIFFAAKDGEDLYSQQKQDRELTVA